MDSLSWRPSGLGTTRVAPAPRVGSVGLVAGIRCVTGLRHVGDAGASGASGASETPPAAGLGRLLGAEGDVRDLDRVNQRYRAGRPECDRGACDHGGDLLRADMGFPLIHATGIGDADPTLRAAHCENAEPSPGPQRFLSAASPGWPSDTGVAEC